MTKFKLMLKF